MRCRAEVATGPQTVGRERVIPGLGAVNVAPDLVVQAIVAGWPTRVEGDRGLGLGLRPADDLPTTLAAYRARYV